MAAPAHGVFEGSFEQWIYTFFKVKERRSDGNWRVFREEGGRYEKDASVDVSETKRWYTDFGRESMALSEYCARRGIPEPQRENESSLSRQKRIEAEAQSREVEAAAKRKEALAIWNEAEPASGSHPYIERKKIDAAGLRVVVKGRGDWLPAGTLLVPGRGLDGEFLTAQRIFPDGEKKMLMGSMTGALFAASGADRWTPDSRPVALAEGMATAKTLQNLFGDGVAVVTCFSSSNFESAARKIREKHPEQEILICPDELDTPPEDDTPQKQRARETNKKAILDLARFGKVVTMPAGSPRSNYDWNDYSADYGTDAARIALSNAMQDAAAAEEEDHKPRKRKFKLTLIGDIELRPPEFLVRDLIEKNTVVSIFGQPESGKSFFCLDLCLSVAAGINFHGHSIDDEGAPCVYICGEGFQGITRRAAAWSAHHKTPLKGLPLLVSETAADFLDDDGLAEVIDAADEAAEIHGTPAIIAVDTLNRSFGCGDENSTKDMSRFVAALDTLRHRYPGSVVTVVHHSGVMETERSRGSSVLKGALDAEFKVEKKGESVSVENKKMKDAPKIPMMYFELKDVSLGTSDTGNEYGSAVLVRMDRESEEKAEKKPLTRQQHAVLQTYREAAASVGTMNGRGQFAGLHLDAWRPVFYKSATQANEKSKEKAFLRGRNDLVYMGVLRVENDFYFPAGDLADFEIAEFEKVLKENDEANRRRRQSGDIKETCLQETGDFRRQTETCVLRHVSMSPTVSEENLTDSTIPEDQDITKKKKDPSPLRGEKKALADAERASAEKWYSDQPEEWRADLEAKAREGWSPIMARSPEDAIQSAILASYKLAHEKPAKKPYSEILAEGGADDAAV